VNKFFYLKYHLGSIDDDKKKTVGASPAAFTKLVRLRKIILNVPHTFYLQNDDPSKNIDCHPLRNTYQPFLSSRQWSGSNWKLRSNVAKVEFQPNT
jgi:hypothetical protein